MRARLSFNEYTRTWVQNSANNGDPLIAPLFYHFPGDEKTYDLTSKQFMYGPAIHVSRAFEKDTEMYLPSGTWCGLTLFGNAGCVTSTGQSGKGENWG